MEEQIAAMAISLEHISKTLDSVQDKSTKTHETVVRLDERAKTANKRIEALENTANDYIKMKSRGIGVLAGISLAAGGLGAFISKMLH